MDLRFYSAATWVGGGYILGTAEMVYDPLSGVAYAFAMWAGPLSMFISKSVL